MYGNVKEWCSDRSSYDRAPTDGSSWETGTDERRVLKGGSWYYSDGICGAGVRHREFANTSSIDSGFRVAYAIADEFP